MTALVYGTRILNLKSGLSLFHDILSILKCSLVARSYFYYYGEDSPAVIFTFFKDSDDDKGQNALSNWIMLESMKIYLCYKIHIKDILSKIPCTEI